MLPLSKWAAAASSSSLNGTVEKKNAARFSAKSSRARGCEFLLFCFLCHKDWDHNLSFLHGLEEFSGLSLLGVRVQR